MLTSLQNPLIKQIRKFTRAKERRLHNQLLLEGTHLAEEALRADANLVTVLCTEEWQARYPDLAIALQQQAQRVELVTPEILQAIATTQHPDGVIATAIPSQRSTLDWSACTLGLALETLQDPGNLGTLIRTAVATNVHHLWLSTDSVDPTNPKVLRASAGQWFRLPMMTSPSLATDLLACKEAGMQIIGTASKGAVPYWNTDFRKPTIVLLGNEGAGLSASLLALADQTIHIPLENEVESLNVAIAAALILYEVKRQRSQD